MGFSKYPAELDDSISLPPSLDLITPVKAEVVNRLRDAILATQAELGVTPSGTFGTVKARLDSLESTINGVVVELGVNPSGTFDTIAERLNAIDSAILNLGGDTGGHIDDTSNPHEVTAAQTGAPDLVSPSTDEAVVRFSGTSGQMQNSPSGPFANDSGQLGIGTSPSVDLEVSGTARATDIQATDKIRITERTGDPASVANNAFLYSKDDAGISEPFFEDDAGTITQIVRDGSILNTLNVRDFGAEPNVAGGGDAIQDAINKFIDNQDKYNAIIIPPGEYKLTQPLFCIPTAGAGFQKTVMISSGRFSLGGPSFGGCIFTLEGDGYQDWPVMIIQAGRGCYFEGITFQNTGNTAPFDNLSAEGTNAAYAFPDREDWSQPGTRTNRRSPNCAVAIDPFTDGYPGSDINNAYPGLEDYYGGPLYPSPNAGSSATTFNGCTFRGGYVGVASSPPGDISGVDVVQNNENNLFDQCQFVYNTYHYATGQSQERGNTLRGFSAYGSWCAVSTELVGPGGNHANCPYIKDANIGGTNYVFDINALQKVYISNVYIESSASLGKLGIGATGTQGGVHIDGLTMAPNIAGENLPEIPFHIQTFGLVEISNSNMASRTGNQGFIRLFSSNGRVTLRNFSVTTRSEFNDHHVPFGFNKKEVIFGHPWQSYNPGVGAVYHDDPLSEISYLDLDGDPIVQVVQNGSDLGSGTISLTSTAGIEVGDMVRIATNSPNAYTPQVISPGEVAYAYQGPVAMVTSIDIDDSITLDRLPYEFPFDTDLRLEVIRWTNFDFASLAGLTFQNDVLYEVYEADGSPVEDLDVVTEWVSQDSSAKTFTSSDPSFGPDYDADVLEFNHQPGILFGDGYYLEYTDSKLNTNFLHNGSGATVILGFNYDSANPGTLLSTLGGSSGNVGFQISVDGYGSLFTKIGNGSGTYVVDSDSGAVLQDGYAYVVSVRHGTASSPQFDVRIDSASVDSGSYVGSASGSNSTDDLTMGAQSGGADSFGSHIFFFFASLFYLSDALMPFPEDRLLNRIGR